jgi:ABC-type glycerol-3-phosphate transport system permease component
VTVCSVLGKLVMASTTAYALVALRSQARTSFLPILAR